MLMFLLVACSGKDLDSGEAEAPPTLTELQADVFTPVCSGCHGATDPSGGMDLTDGATFASLVGVASTGDATQTRVVAGDSAASYIVMKLEGAAGITGDKMPQGGTIDEHDLEHIVAWIDDGAQNN